MTAILDLIGWPAALFSSAMAAWRLYTMAVPPRNGAGKLAWSETFSLSSLLALLIWSGGAVAFFALLGVIGPLAGALYAGIAAAVVLLLAKVWTHEGRHALRGHFSLGPRESFREARGSGRSLLAWLRSRFGDEGEPAPVVAAVAEHVATRGIPSVMNDPVLGPPPEPAELATGAVPVPAPWAALAQWIGTREPGDDMELRMFSDGDAVGALAVADAYHAYADLCLNGLGLSPAYVAGVLEAGDSAGSHASVVAQVHKRFGVIYGAIKEWVGAHGPLPHKAREFLTEDGT